MTYFRVTVTVLLLLLAYLQTQLWVGQASYVSNKKLSSLIAKTKQANQKLEVRNSQLYAEILSLKAGNEAIIAKARIDLGMVKQGEVFYQVVGADS